MTRLLAIALVFSVGCDKSTTPSLPVGARKVADSDAPSVARDVNNDAPPDDDPLVEVVHTIGKWSGQGIKGTETFTVPTHEWGLAWDVSGDGFFSVTVHDADTGSMVGSAGNVIGNSSDFSVIRGAGERYLEINAANVNWKLTAMCVVKLRQSVLDAEKQLRESLEAAEREKREAEEEQLRKEQDAQIARLKARREEEERLERERAAKQRAGEEAARRQRELMAEEEKAIVGKTVEPVDERRERIANGKLLLAEKYMEQRRPDAAKKLLNEIVVEYKGTEAAAKATLMLLED